MTDAPTGSLLEKGKTTLSIKTSKTPVSLFQSEQAY